MKPWNLFAIAVATCLMLVGTRSAHAEMLPIAEIVCSREANVALIRFGMREEGYPATYSKLPRAIDAGLSSSKQTGRTDCRLPNGWQFRMRSGSKPAKPYGMGGADPPAYFSLWVNQHRVVSRREWKPGYGEGYFDGRPSITALVIRPDRLTWCRAPRDKPQRCQSEPLNLNRHRVDLVEYPKSGRKWRVGTLLTSSGAASSKFCESYVRAIRGTFDHIIGRGDDRSPFAYTLPREKLTFPRDGRDFFFGPVSVAPQTVRQVIYWGNQSTAMDGDVVMFVPTTVDIRKLATKLQPIDPDKIATLKLPAGWTRIIGGTPQIYPEAGAGYVHFRAQQIDRRLYFLAYPANEEREPTAMLLGLKPEGGTRLICTLRRVEPHF